MAAGRFRAEWVEPATGAVLDAHELTHGGGECPLTTPPHAVDVALRVQAV